MVLDGIVNYLKVHGEKDVVLVDSVRTPEQIAHLRSEFGERFVHIHVTAPYEIVKERYDKRGSVADTGMQYDAVRSDPTESGVWLLDRIADRVVENWKCKPPSLLAKAVAGLGLFPPPATPLVDVIVSGQYGSEGKGHVCAHLAGGYGVLVRVGGPNAGHNVATPKYNYRQLPSGTQTNKGAKILIAAGSTILPAQILESSAVYANTSLTDNADRKTSRRGPLKLLWASKYANSLKFEPVHHQLSTTRCLAFVLHRKRAQPFTQQSFQ